MRKHMLLLLLAAAAVLVLFACEKREIPDSSQTDDDESSSAEETEQITDVQTTDGQITDEQVIGKQTFSISAEKSIDALRAEIGETPAQFGMAYIGYFGHSDETGIDFAQWYEAASGPLAAEYSFVSEIDENHRIGTEGHLYCIVAKNADTSVSVHEAGDESLLYQAENGNPILLFSNLDGNAQAADMIVTFTGADGKTVQWMPVLDQLGYPDLLIGEERELLSWDFTPVPDSDFVLKEWLAEGWFGSTALGLAWDENGINWWISTWDSSVHYCLNLSLHQTETQDGEAVLECFYADDSTIQSEWRGVWHLEIEMEQPSRLYLDLTLTSGADMAAFSDASTVSESYWQMVSQSGNYILLVADDAETVRLPIFPDGVKAVELTRADG